MKLRINIPKENILFFLFNALYFSCSSLYFGFLIVYLNSHGYSSLECNLINTLICVCSLFFQPVVGFITDTFIHTKKYLLIAGTLSIFVLFLLPLTINNSILATISILAMSLLFTPLCFLADTWAVTLRERIPTIDYGKVRAGGSIGYSLTSIIAGNLLSSMSYNILFTGSAIVLTILMIVIIFIPKIPCANKRGHSKLENPEKSLSFVATLKILFKNPNYVLFITSSCLFFCALKPLVVNMPYKIMDIGGGDYEVGIASAVGAICELPIFFLLRPLIRKFKISYLYLASTLFLVLRTFLLVIGKDFSLVLLSQGVQAFTYSLFLSTNLEYISRIIPQNIRATGITFSVAMTNGLASIVGTLLGGILVSSFGFNSLAITACGLAIVSFFAFAMPVFTKRKQDSALII